ncbi:hypothetical protein GCM10023116_10800 [Kistimonas scapharcae]|uniref:Tyrosine specific protein phosphatases domain-containing protein n=1 Tax=Kistimonas scapharcae TaxID=1036133 RepID=A0ABP8UYU6_9GAMM
MSRLMVFLLALSTSLLSTLSLSAYAERDEGDSPFISTELNNLPYEREWVNTLRRESSTQFNPERLQLVHCDEVSGNCLFRSSLPQKGNDFAYGELRQAMQSAYRARMGASLPARFELVDISLLNWFTDAKELQLEKQYFRMNPEKGRFKHHAIYGALSSPNAYPETMKNWLEVLPSMGEISALEDDLGYLISTVNDKPQMVVVHCRAGHDRTGEVVAAFQMRYLGMSHREAFAKANATKGHPGKPLPINPLSRNGLMWYAYYLRDVMGISTVGDIE